MKKLQNDCASERVNVRDKVKSVDRRQKAIVCRTISAETPFHARSCRPQGAGITSEFKNDNMSSMTREFDYRRRRTAVFILLCVVVLAQSAALWSAIEPHHAGHCCLLCHVGSLPFLQLSDTVSVTPVMVMERLLPHPDVEASHDVLLTANSSRAPPV
jgi:hypothetical protein